MWYPGSGVVLDCMVSSSLQYFLLLQFHINLQSNIYLAEVIKTLSFRPLIKSAKSKKQIFLFLNQNICCGYSKDCSFEHAKQIIKLMDKKIFRILC